MSVSSFRKVEGEQLTLFVELVSSFMDRMNTDEHVIESQTPLFTWLAPHHATCLAADILVGLVCEDEPLPCDTRVHRAAFAGLMETLRSGLELECDMEQDEWCEETCGRDLIAAMTPEHAAMYLDMEHESAMMAGVRRAAARIKVDETPSSTVNTPTSNTISSNDGLGASFASTSTHPDRFEMDARIEALLNAGANMRVGEQRALSELKRDMKKAPGDEELLEDYNAQEPNFAAAEEMVEKIQSIGGLFTPGPRTRPLPPTRELNEEEAQAFRWRRLAWNSLTTAINRTFELSWVDSDHEAWTSAIELVKGPFRSGTAAITDITDERWLYGEVYDQHMHDPREKSRIALVVRAVREERASFEREYTIEKLVHAQRVIGAVCRPSLLETAEKIETLLADLETAIFPETNEVCGRERAVDYMPSYALWLPAFRCALEAAYAAEGGCLDVTMETKNLSPTACQRRLNALRVAEVELANEPWGLNRPWSLLQWFGTKCNEYRETEYWTKRPLPPLMVGAYVNASECARSRTRTHTHTSAPRSSASQRARTPTRTRLVRSPPERWLPLFLPIERKRIGAWPRIVVAATGPRRHRLDQRPAPVVRHCDAGTVLATGVARSIARDRYSISPFRIVFVTV